MQAVGTRMLKEFTVELSVNCTDLEVGENLAGSSDLLLQEAHDVVPAELAGFRAAVPVHNCKHARRNLAFESFGCCKPVLLETSVLRLFYAGAEFVSRHRLVRQLGLHLARLREGG